MIFCASQSLIPSILFKPAIAGGDRVLNRAVLLSLTHAQVIEAACIPTVSPVVVCEISRASWRESGVGNVRGYGSTRKKWSRAARNWHFPGHHCNSGASFLCKCDSRSGTALSMSFVLHVSRATPLSTLRGVWLVSATNLQM